MEKRKKRGMEKDLNEAFDDIIDDITIEEIKNKIFEVGISITYNYFVSIVADNICRENRNNAK